MNLSRVIWRKSSRSEPNGNCVEVGDNFPGVVALRDSKDPSGPALVFSPTDWEAFVVGVKDGAFDL